MSGFITTHNLVLDSWTIIRELGFPVYLRAWRIALRPGKGTFLEAMQGRF